MNSAFIFPNSTPVSSESGDGGGNGGKIFKGTLKPVWFVTHGVFVVADYESGLYFFLTSTPIP